TVVRVADSLKAEFKTRNGRAVYDGGGLDPDVKVENKYLGTVTTALMDAGLIFEFASRYCSENSRPADFKNFRLSDREYESFLAWLKTQNFTYTTSLEKNTRQLIEMARGE